MRAARRRRGRPARVDAGARRAARARPTARSPRSTCRATSICSSAPAATSPCRSATTACWSSTPGWRRTPSKVLAAIKKLSDKPIRWILNTHFHPDHTGGNEAVAKAGSTTSGGPAEILAHENVLTRMSAPGRQDRRRAVVADRHVLPRGEGHLLQRRSRDAVITTWPRTPTATRSCYFRKSDVVVAGDMFVTTRYPFIDQANGGSIQGELNALNRILDIAVPAHEQEGGTFVIPGHGRICDEADVLEYRDMVTIVRDRIQDMIKRGLTHRSGEGGQADARLRPPLRVGHRLRDHRGLRRGGVQGPLEPARANRSSGRSDWMKTQNRATGSRLRSSRDWRCGRSSRRPRPAAAAAGCRRRPRARRGRSRRSTSPATGWRSSPKTGAGAC